MHMKGCDIAIELCIDWGDCSMCVCVLPWLSSCSLCTCLMLHCVGLPLCSHCANLPIRPVFLRLSLRCVQPRQGHHERQTRSGDCGGAEEQQHTAEPEVSFGPMH